MQVVGAVHQGLAVVRRVVGEFGVRVCSVAGMLVLPFASEHAWLHARSLIVLGLSLTGSRARPFLFSLRTLECARDARCLHECACAVRVPCRAVPVSVLVPVSFRGGLCGAVSRIAW